MSALEIEHLRVRRGGREVLALDALNLTPGETLAVLGPNGAGKSSLLLAAALLIPAEGVIRYDGVVRTRGNAVTLRRRSSTVFQDSALLDMTARRNVEQALAIHGVPREARRQRTERCLDRLGVSERAGARPHQLSGGEAQRVSLARALAVEPRLLFLDEPFSGLDLGSRGRLVGEMRTLIRETGVTAFLATHDQAEAAVLADRVLIVDRGTVLDCGPMSRVLSRPVSPEVAAILGFSLLGAEAARWLGLDGRGTHVAVPPSAIRVQRAEHDALGRPRAVVRAIEGVAGGVRLRLSGDVGLSGGVEGGPATDVGAEVSINDFHRHGWNVGEIVAVEVDAVRAVWF